MHFSGAVEVFQNAFEFAPVVLVRVFDSGGEEGDSGVEVTADTFADEEELCNCVMEVDGLFFR